MVYFVGAGPGAEDLITLRGARLLSEADLIIYAGSLVNPALLKRKKPSARVLDSAYMTLEEVLKAVEAEEAAGGMTVRLHTGDPSIYGAVREQMEGLSERGIPYEVCPGVSSFSAAAASLGIEYTLPGVSQSLIITRAAGRTAVPEKESPERFAEHGATMVFFLSTGLAGKLKDDLIRGGLSPETPAAVVYKASWPEEMTARCCLGELPETVERLGIRNTALLIVGEVLRGSGMERSRLYDPAFTTGFRRAAAAEGKESKEGGNAAQG